MAEENPMRNLKYLVEELTLSGKDTLDERPFKSLKKICKKSDLYIFELHRLLMKQFEKKHAEIRFSSFLICNEIFRKSHCFRELLLKDFTLFTDLVLGLDPQRPLPKPISVAENLKKKAIEAIQQWYDEFKNGYNTLVLGYNFLRDCKNVDFVEFTARTAAERQRIEVERRKAEEVKRQKLVKISHEMDSLTPEVKDLLKQFRNCFKLLIPDVEDLFGSPGEVDDLFVESSPIEGSKGKGKGKGKGQMNSLNGENSDENKEESESESENEEFSEISINIQININDIHKVQETNDNKVLIDNLREHVKMLSTKYLPDVKNWEQIIRPYSDGNGELVKKILDIKIAVQKAITTFNKLTVLPIGKLKENLNDLSDSDDDDDFEEWNLPEAVLLGMTAIESSSSSCSNKIKNDDHENQPSTSGYAPSVEEPKCKKKKYMTSKSRCPDDYKLDSSSTLKRQENPMAGLSQVWTGTDNLHERDEVEGTGGVLGVATQRIEYERAWEPIRWACRALLPSGRLCPRMDRERCPLHGPIIPRNDLGEALNADDAAAARAAREKYEREHPDWQDPTLLAEIKAETGFDLNMKRVKERRGKHDRLTNVKKAEDTPRNRLAKKVFCKKALRRTNAVLAREGMSSKESSNCFRFG
ncbi:unnamed protein product [Meganyctiphanes norvegica]|uniref:UV-stimulated scaffold protein A C-terminal domain-containing protein n=1 Tax=Meganyctiphanes norvegica TaxID=48144 RepID=A0AAV2QVU1_MEGNR